MSAPPIWQNVDVQTDAPKVLLNFTGASYVVWKANTDIDGDTLTNNTHIKILDGSAYSNNSVSLIGGIVFKNQGTVDFSGNGKWYLKDFTEVFNYGDMKLSNYGDIYVEDGFLYNQSSGHLVFTSNGAHIIKSTSNGHQKLENYGLIQKYAGTGVSKVDISTSSWGIISAESGELEFADTLYNQTGAVIKGIANLDLPPVSIFFNEGTFAPGLSPGELTVLGDFTSTSSSVLDVELQGLQQGSTYDHLYITGDATVFGGINVSLGFQPALNDEFTILSIGGSNLTTSLPSTVSATYNGGSYLFEVLTTSNTIKLKLISSPFPVELIHFLAQRKEDFVQLDWITTNEINSEKFEIERSRDGVYFEYVGEEKSAGGISIETAYQFWDYRPYEGVNYYRLRQVDVDGHAEYSEVVSVYMPEANPIAVYPNPVERGQVLFIDTEDTAIYRVEVYTPNGQHLAKADINENEIELPWLCSGYYILKVFTSAKVFSIPIQVF